MKIYLCRHGETEWSRSGQHTGSTDLPLTPEGERQAEILGRRLQGVEFDTIYASPLQRAAKTAQIAGFEAQIDPDLVEWDYGDYEGLTTPQIREKVPDWTIFGRGAPNGESVDEVGERADRVLQRLDGDTILLFSSGHFSRVLAARWLGFGAEGGRYLLLNTASVSILGYDRQQRALALWNETHFLSTLSGEQTGR